MSGPELGVALRAAYGGTDDQILRAYDRWADSVGAYPKAVAIWVHDGRAHWQRASSRLLDEGVQVVIYLESGEHARDEYRGVLTGRFDHVLARVDDPRLLVRIDHEMLPGAPFPWAGHPGPRYVDAFRYMKARVAGRAFWCPQGHTPRHRELWPQYYPGHDAADVVGWDRYVRQQHPATPIPKAWAANIAHMQALAPGKPIVVGEMGIEDPHPQDRAAWLATLPGVPVVKLSLYFDLDLLDTEGVSWRMDRPMKGEAYEQLTQE